ncbi:uncharacterized protein LOC122072746 isoform X2 [Macadamia integrifolia]|uniref:uncharacterized protein LOC122072746 isoform X2 n=1 Tax=Macadamia integrifolia TaxID=60698 RepID=UPI001C4F319B|nr:uncharacterized protein LOC122072746 isoform X2 [Macadamia integrifolia]
MMILNPATVVVPRGPPLRRAFTVTNISSTEQLRTQLDQLHSEAEKTIFKANNARLRLMRLSEAAEKLKQRAAMDIRLGKENEARELLVQKKKLMQALEKSKSRIELLDKLSAKLNEAISVKETQLVSNVALDLEVGRADASGPIRIIPPKEEMEFDPNKNEDFNPDTMDLDEDQPEQFETEFQANLSINQQQEDIEEGTVSMRIWNEENINRSFKDISSYEDFLEHVDQQLNKIEVEVATVLRLWTLVLDSEEQSKNSNVQHTFEILENVRGIRERCKVVRTVYVSTQP